MEVLCKCARKPTSTPKIANAEKQRPTSSTRCGCTFKVKVSWNKNTPPTMGKVCLEHVDECSAEVEL
ncbi:unnamed protein product, partial [Laminaria digitata]